MYTKVTWNNGELLTRDKLLQLSTNQDWLYQTTPRVRFMDSDVNTVKMVASKITHAPTKATRWVDNISFGNFFSEGCTPLVFPSLSSTGEDEIFLTVRGTTTPEPDNKGASIVSILWYGSGKTKYTEGTIYINWFAIGF